MSVSASSALPSPEMAPSPREEMASSSAPADAAAPGGGAIALPAAENPPEPIKPAPPPQKPPAPPPAPPSLMDRFKGNVGGEGEGDGAQMGFMDHLLELRKRLWASVLTIVVCMGLSLVYYNELFALMRAPLDNLNAANRGTPGYKEMTLISTDPMDSIVMVMWLSIGAGIVFASPLVIYQLWAFIAPGLRSKEKRAIKPILYGGIFFFLGGCAVAYYLLFPVSIRFFGALNDKLLIESKWTIEKYSSLLLNMMAIAGLICETPLVVAAFAKLGLLKPELLTRYWRACLMISFILGSLFSPGTEIMSMLLFSGLLMALYIVSIFMAYAFYPRELKK